MTPRGMAVLHAQTFTTPRPWTAEEFAALMARGEVITQGTDDAFAMVRVTLDEGELLTVTVAPHLRGAGAGARLVRGILRAAVDRGARRCFLEVAQDNMAARALYLSCGFHDAGRRKAYYRTPGGSLLDAIVMLRHLTETEHPA